MPSGWTDCATSPERTGLHLSGSQRALERRLNGRLFVQAQHQLRLYEGSAAANPASVMPAP